LYDRKEDAFLNSYLSSFNDKKLSLRLIKDAGKWQIVSNREVLINGVAWRKRYLKSEDIIYLGEYRLVFVDNFIENVPPEPVGGKAPKKKILRFIEAAAVILGISFLWYCTTISHNSNLDLNEQSQVSTDHEASLPYDTTEEFDRSEYQPFITDEERGESSLLVYAPGENPTPQKLDILFIHTHPDDESLDYGLFLAEAAAEGESTGVIIFTDGDSGFDKYPDRPIDGIYPDAELGVPDLSKIRVEEAVRALTVLNAKVYVRLGLWNRPYTSEEVNKNLNTLLNEWGEETFLVNKLVSLIETFKPDVIVSPDGPSTAREHFEHEAVGYLSEKAVNLYIERNPGKLRSYLKLVDVQQLAAYGGIPLLDIDASENGNLKDIKRRALMMHQTQADASYFGIKRLEEFPLEYYIMQYNSNSTDNSVLTLLAPSIH
ncbi:MAG: PIG-L family deacetylase, partial [Spirochaetaceae bacterium]|nr:PIG-L family deacetylase [Spirochaetaceae bacterium]